MESTNLAKNTEQLLVVLGDSKSIFSSTKATLAIHDSSGKLKKIKLDMMTAEAQPKATAAGAQPTAFPRF